MSESISNIRGIPSTHPVKPSRATSKDRKSGKQQREQPKLEPDEVAQEPNDSDDAADNDQPLIDEYV